MLLITCFILGLLGSLTWAAGPRGRTVCPPGTFAYNNRIEWNCYQFYEDELPFEDAEVQCQFRRKGHLASFNSDQQTKSLAAYVKKENTLNRFVWIGLRRDEGSSVTTGWYWVDGSRTTFRKWTTGEPLPKNEFCVSLDSRYGSLTWAGLACSIKLPFLCKWTPA